MNALHNRPDTVRHNPGKRITFYVPGMFRLDGVCGKYPAISITGSRCALNCDHCKGKILESMTPATSSRRLVDTCLAMAEKGNTGVLISGGCDRDGRLPWPEFAPAISEIKARTRLFVSVHSGLLDLDTACRLKEAGVDQALIDVIGDDQTFRDVYHVPFGVSRIEESLESLQKAGLPTVPHIVCGLFHGRIQGEWNALEMIARFEVDALVVVSLMRLRGTPFANAPLPPAEAVAGLISAARRRLPTVPISLGCARQRGNPRLELLALDAGVNRLALPSDEVIQEAQRRGLDIRYQQTCCSVPEGFSQTRAPG